MSALSTPAILSNTFLSPQAKRQQAQAWFAELRDRICAAFEGIEAAHTSGPWSERPAGQFARKTWDRPEGGGGTMAIMKGRVFEKVGVNISVVHGEFSEQFRKEIPGADADPRFWAAGISLVAHLHSPLVPAVHMNTRMICVGAASADEGEGGGIWFGGGADLNPMIADDTDTADFHAAFQTTCDRFDPEYYPKFKAWCDEYFFIKHRNESRGVGGIFYDYLKADWARDFAFTQAVGETFLGIYPELVNCHRSRAWTQDQREIQLRKRGRYAEFNLVYDRGTRFGLMTGGNTEAILMSLPPEAKWD